MRSNAIPFLLMVLILSGFFPSSHSLPAQLLIDTLRAAERLLDFFFARPDQMDLDSALGVAMAEGKLNSIILEIGKNSLQSFPDAVGNLDYLKRRCSKLSSLNKERMQTNYKVLARLLDPWFWSNENLNLTCEKYFYNSFETIDPIDSPNRPYGTTSDSCIAALLSQPCKGVSPACWREEFEPEVTSATDYALSHRLIFTHVAWKVSNCTSKMKRKLPSAMCAICEKILTEAKEIERKGFPSEYQDLFMEQVALCGGEGFRTFANSSWLRRILSWQRNSGCYGNALELQNYGKFIRLRYKRSVTVMDYGCLSHTSGVALASLIANIRNLVETY